MTRILKSLSLLSPLQHAVLLFTFLITVLTCANAAVAASKPHVVAFGKWTTVQSNMVQSNMAQSNMVQWTGDPGAAGDKTVALKVRPLLVDARVKEFTLGFAHDVTDRLFAVRRAFRLNDSLPQESAAPPHWQWQRGGWLLVDRATGHISALNLPEFDILYSAASWYRDYAAYCGVSEDGRKLYAVVAQIGRRKPVLKKLLEGATFDENVKDEALQDSACPIPDWQRAPARVTFEPAGSPKQTFAIRGHAVDLINESEEQDEEASK